MAIPKTNRGSGVSAIVLFKSQRPWCHHVISKLSLTQSLKVVYAAPRIREAGIDGLIYKINQLIEETNAERIFFFIDFFYGLDHDFVTCITPRVMKILVTLDDLTLHEFNLRTAMACDLVLSADPVSVLKYLEAGMGAGFFLLESSRSLYKPQQLVKTTDVLFFGNEELADRKDYLEYLRESGVSVRSIGGKERYIDASSLVDEIARAKIVINFSKTGLLDHGNDGQLGPRFLFQLKGRVVEAGLCRTACISEDAPAIQLLFNENEVPVFRSPRECLALVSELLGDDKKRNAISKSLFEKCISKFEDRPLMKQVEELIDRKKVQNEGGYNQDPGRLPMWYRKKVVRARIQLVWSSQRMMIRELMRVLNPAKSYPMKDSAGLFFNTLGWVGYHFLRRSTR